MYKEELEKCNVADNLQSGLELYLTRGIIPGDFLYACLTNNLMEAFGRASTRHWDYIYNVMMFLYNYAPTNSWGSVDKVKTYSQEKQMRK